jgi:hypothetical protein
VKSTDNNGLQIGAVILNFIGDMGSALFSIRYTLNFGSNEISIVKHTINITLNPSILYEIKKGKKKLLKTQTKKKGTRLKYTQIN